MKEIRAKTELDTAQAADRADAEAMATQLWQIIGAIKLGNRLATALSAQAIHGLEKIRDEKLYRVTGFETFDSFLEKHPQSPMSHDTFRRRVNLLAAEGDATFDLLNSLNVPFTARALLAGNVAIDGDFIVINEDKGDTVSSTRIPLNDRTAVVNAFTELKKKADELQRTNERGKKDNEKWKRKFGEAQEQLAKGLAVSEDAAPHARALVSSLGSLQILADECKALANEKERKRFAPIAFQRLAEATQQVEEALGFKSPTSALNLNEAEIAAAGGD